MDDEDWSDLEAAVFDPLEDDDAGLAARPSVGYLERLVIDMSPTDRAYAERWLRRGWRSASRPKGARVLTVAYGGRSTTLGSDGSDVDTKASVGQTVLRPRSGYKREGWFDWDKTHSHPHDATPVLAGIRVRNREWCCALSSVHHTVTEEALPATERRSMVVGYLGWSCPLSPRRSKEPSLASKNRVCRS